MQRKVLIIGAGRIGKGYIGEEFEKNNWNVVFLDKDPKVIDNLAKGSYQVRIANHTQVYDRTVSKYRQILTSEHHKEIDDFLSADIVMIPVYPEDLKDIFEYLIFDFNAMAKRKPDKQLDIVLLTNKVYLVKKIYRLLEKSTSSELSEWINKHIFIRDAIIRRSTDAESNSALKLNSMDEAPLLVEAPLHIPSESILWVKTMKNVPTLKEVKIYTINGPHATTAFFGKYKNYTTIPDAQQDSDVSNLANEVLDETYKVCAKEFNITFEDMDHLTKLPSLKQEVPDSIKRVAYDPLRKLSNNDRLCGPIKLCEKYDLSHDGLDKAVALGLKYYDEDDPKSIEMQNLIKEKGILSAIKEITGLDDDCAQKILAQYKKL